MEQHTASDLVLEVRNGDAVLAEANIIPSVIKIDVEGHEKKVLQGLCEPIQKHRPFIVFEYGSFSRNDFRDVNDLNAIFGEGYYYYSLKRSREKPALAPFDPPKKWENILATPEPLGMLKS